ncbi:MAG TPA: hypothetical protein VGS10_17760 [Terracidiphilus sp.]|nr:hypothetical protein [Terracidiphilus sp.]
MVKRPASQSIWASLVGLFLLLAAGPKAGATSITIGPHNVVKVGGKPVFPIGFITGPPDGSKTPSGQDAYAELKSNGTVFLWAGVFQKQKWDPESEAQLDRMMALCAKNGLLTAISIFPLEAIGPNDPQKADELRRVVKKYSHDPALGFWKAKDEPAWSRTPAADIKRYSGIVRKHDPNHPIWLIYAPRGTAQSLRAYNPADDIADTDIYPVGYPPGADSLGANKDISMVGDYAQRLQRITEGKKPFFMTLQICWSGVTKPGKTLRMPTFPQERYMAYEAIVNGARGLDFFGGMYKGCQDERDRKLGWNWNFYFRVLKPVLSELNPRAPLYPALVAPDSTLHVKLTGAGDVEYLVREARGFLYILATKRQGATVQVKFSGLSAGISTGKVLYEPPRTVSVENGQFSDWFAPHDVHVYRFKLP